MKLRTILASPWTYGAWFALLVTAFVVAYFYDPYVYAFTVLGLGAISGLVAVCGVAASVLGARAGRTGSAWWIGAGTIGIVATTLAALVILKGFRWA